MNENNINIEFPIIEMRPYQEEIWDRFINNDIYLTILIWHRRGGKDIFSFNSLVEKLTLYSLNFLSPNFLTISNLVGFIPNVANNLINSKAISEHCRKIKHKFNTEELAVLIYRNRTMSIDEKISIFGCD